jgi:nudix-type nucleoside diphosphatase (YffH/AdpP family)
MDGAQVDGIVIEGLSDEEVERLDAYEIPFDYNPVEMIVCVEAQDARARVYLPGDSVDISGRLWSFDRWCDHSGELSREMAREIGAYDPPLTGEQLHRQWKMIGTRAAARVRAAREEQPADIRFAGTSKDFGVTRDPNLHGNFFKFADFEVTHRTFQGQRSEVLPREIFVGTDAAIVLPYDPKTDRVLLVEQIRMGPLMRGAQNPWILEPIAGMIDGGETPEQSGLRESEEEAGLTEVTLEKMFSYYPSSGGTTDYFYCFLGLCDLPEETTYTGGLETESEDLRLHVLPFDDAFALIETGEANMGSLITMLLWLSRNRDRLRGIA